MTKIFLLDDDPSVTTILKLIIEQKKLGKVCGVSQDAREALEDLEFLEPDLVIADLLMPEIDGIEFVKRAREILPDAFFIMLSQVSNKDMLASAYEAGVEVFIQKPINSIEVINVIQNVSKKQELQRTMDQITKILPGTAAAGSAASAPPDRHAEEKENLRRILSRIGIRGENGADDILTACDYFIDNDEEPGRMTVKELCSHFSDSPKSMEQRIRRAASAGMANLANMGLDDYYNDTFVEYSTMLYDSDQMRQEMNYQQGKSEQRGNVKIRKFITALVNASRES